MSDKHAREREQPSAMAKQTSRQRNPALQLGEGVLRHGAAASAKVPAVPPGVGRGLHMTIGVAPTGEVSIMHDLQMVKATLLYADTATLCSPMSNAIVAMLQFGDLNNDEQLVFYEQMLPVLIDDQAKLATARNKLHNYKILKRKKTKKLRSDELRQIMNWDSFLTEQWPVIQAIVLQQANNAGADGILAALKTGIIELAQFQSFSSDDLVTEYFELVRDAITDGKTYPLFDDTTGNLIQAALREGLVRPTDSALIRSRHGGLVGELMERLPLFEAATVAEIMDIRRELDKHLDRFRAAVIGYSQDIRTAQWDADFSSDADQTYRKLILPTIEAIEEEVKANSYLSALIPKLYKQPLMVVSGSVLGFVVAPLASLDVMLREALNVGVASAIVVSEAFKDWRDKQKAIEQNQLYFYYRARKSLSGRGSPNKD